MSYATIVADPPWPIKWTGGSTSSTPNAEGPTYTYEKLPLPYATMPVDEIAALPIETLAAGEAHLFMWTLDRFVIDGSAATICRAWGFEPLPQMLVWHKANAGLGRIVRPAHESILIGRRGGARLEEISTVSVHGWRQPYANGGKKHSAKPDGMLDLVERLSPGPYLELFARRARLGWDYWGDESHGTVEMSA